ncbi:hypothetical protein NEHOM01_2349 [Nematocida homosporus]|nr:hypothetical protein NEHOM01_2349 [Nematocida homosporus]
MSRRTAGARAGRAVERTRRASNCERTRRGALGGRVLVSRAREAGRTARARKGPRGGGEPKAGRGSGQQGGGHGGRHPGRSVSQHTCRTRARRKWRALQLPPKVCCVRYRFGRVWLHNLTYRYSTQVAWRRASGEGRRRWRLEGARARILEGVADLGAKGRGGEGFPQERAGPKRHRPWREGEEKDATRTDGSGRRVSTLAARGHRKGIHRRARSDTSGGEEAPARSRGCVKRNAWGRVPVPKPQQVSEASSLWRGRAQVREFGKIDA